MNHLLILLWEERNSFTVGHPVFHSTLWEWILKLEVGGLFSLTSLGFYGSMKDIITQLKAGYSYPLLIIIQENITTFHPGQFLCNSVFLWNNFSSEFCWFKLSEKLEKYSREPFCLGLILNIGSSLRGSQAYLER